MKLQRSIALVLLGILFLTSFPAAVLAIDSTADWEISKIISGFDALPAQTASQSGFVRNNFTVKLPTTLSATITEKTASDEAAEQTINEEIPVTWKSSPSYNANKAGTYIFKPEIPKGYQLAPGCTAPSIQVTLTKSATSVSGLSKKENKKSRSKLTDSITVSPAYGRTVSLQMKSKGKWVTKRTFKLSSAKSSALTLTYPNDWWKRSSSSWRVLIPESDEGKAYTSSTITVSAKRYYQNPSNYIQIKDKIQLKHSGGYNLKMGYMGLKVRKVNQYFKMGSKHWPRYTRQTRNKVKAFQKRKKLKVTGIVDKKTWKKMGFSETSWYTLGAYVSPIKVNPSSTKKQHIEAMISTAKKYLGADYVVGASGKPSQGADCSGLVMQGLYAAGVDPYPVSCVRHSKAGYEYESRNLWKNKKFKSIPYTKKKRGDLIFYKGRGGAIIHIAIYLGNGKVIESWPNKVVIWPIKNSHRSRIAGVKRVFN